jgi:hypothetical protein
MGGIKKITMYFSIFELPATELVVRTADDTKKDGLNLK